MFLKRHEAGSIIFLAGLFGAILSSAGCSDQSNPPGAYKPIASTPSGAVVPASVTDASYDLPMNVDWDAQEPARTAESAYATAWPVAFDTAAGRIEMYQPQPDSLTGNQLKARAAVSLTKPGATQPVFGAIWFTARIVTDRDTRTVTLADTNIRHVRLADSTADQDKQFAASITAQLPQQAISFPLDQLMTSLDLAQREKAEKQEFNNAPPKILFSTVPATLITLNGAPALRPVQGVNGVMRVVNTPFILLYDTEGKHYYLKAGTRWVTAADIAGPWENPAQVPAPIASAGATLAGPATRPTTGPGTQPAAPGALADLAETTADTHIIVATEPTELIVSDGDAKFAALAGSDLFYCSNTQSNLFLDPPAKQYYLLLSGRWFAAPSLQGPWTYVAADKLPAAFASIPADSPKADVLPFVAGTTAAHEAVLDASIPQTAAIRRDAGKDLNVTYDGPPKFEPIQGTSMTYAVNSPDPVIRVNDGYYCCYDGVWYDSSSPTGPWAVCVAVPPEIYTIPPNCPLYNVTYVHVYDYYPDVAYVGYQPGYLESYVYGPTVVYGTGYVYPGYLGEDDYIAPPCTWGFGAYYDPWVCDWGFGFGCLWGPDWFIDFGRHHDHDHRWGGHHWWGPRGFVGYHHLQAVHAAGVPRGIHEANWGDHLAGHFHNLYQRPENANRIASFAHTTARSAGRAEGANNVFAGHDGNIYRRTDAGWEQRQANSWQGIDRIPEARPAYRAPAAPAYHPYLNPSAGMERSYSVRSRGAERSFGFHGGGGFGGFHGGGGRR